MAPSLTWAIPYTFWQKESRKQRGRAKESWSDWKRLWATRDLCVVLGHNTCLQVAVSHSKHGWSQIKSLASLYPEERGTFTRLPILLPLRCTQKRPPLHTHVSCVSLLLSLSGCHRNTQASHDSRLYTSALWVTSLLWHVTS